MFSSQDATSLTSVCPPHVYSPICGARYNKLAVWGEARLDVDSLVVLVAGQGEHGLALEGLHHPDHGSVSGQHHQLPVQTELDSSPITPRLYFVLKC